MATVDTTCRIAAVVVTYNRASRLRECLNALLSQTRPLDEILVIDNASTDETAQMLANDFGARLTVVRLAENTGGAGGFHEGMRRAYGKGHDWMWLMDDDAAPREDCLAKLLDNAGRNTVLVPLQENGEGQLTVPTAHVASWLASHQGKPLTGRYVFSFVGPLIPRVIVELAGLPNPDFFTWYDDTEYSLRIRRKADARVRFVPTAVIRHAEHVTRRPITIGWYRKVRTLESRFKLYFVARNGLYATIIANQDLREASRYFIKQIVACALDLLCEPDRWLRVRTRLAGIRDGALGRLGKGTRNGDDQ